jgi:predicted  nucleic acid-binding Zn-ribbon protein
MADQIKELDTQLAEAKTARDAARGTVEKQWLKTYDTLSAKRGYAVAPVVKGVCQGCHMALPPQLNNILARMESIETCPRCARLVYRKDMVDSPQPPPDAA